MKIKSKSGRAEEQGKPEKYLPTESYTDFGLALTALAPSSA